MSPDASPRTPLTRPLRDAFGTRIDADDLLAGLCACGLEAGRLTLHDDGLLLEHATGSARDLPLMRAVTYLRERLSPLVPLDLRQDPEAPTDRLHLEDRRDRTETRLVFAQCRPDLQDLENAVEFLTSRLPESGPPLEPSPLPDPPEATRTERALAQSLGAALARLGYRGAQTHVIWHVVGSPRPIRTPAPARAPLSLLILHRSEAQPGFRPAFTLVAGTDPDAMDWCLAQLDGEDFPAPGEVLLDGLCWEVGRRPIIAAAPGPARIDRDDSVCTNCGRCAALCPAGILDASGATRPTADWNDCLLCMDCVEGCPSDARRPAYGDSSATRAEHIARRPGWLSRLAGHPGPLFPPVLPPSYLLPRPDAAPPRVILGLAITTMQEHAAVLVRDGEVIGALEEERLIRVRHYGFTPPGRPGVTLAVDPTLALEEAVCNRSVRVLLAQAGLTRDDVDLFVLNGLPARYRRVRSLLDPDRPLPVLRSGRVVCVPHHLAHAASSAYVSGETQGFVFTVDGRGDRETAALFELRQGRLEPRAELLSLSDRSIGAVYEAVTAHLGFGAHGQGSVMALASFGTPDADISPFLSARSFTDVSIHENGIVETFADRRRPPGAPLLPTHQNLAASLQTALEETVHALLNSGGVPAHPPLLALAGGVTLNCRMNQGLQRRYQTRLVVQPAANDAGTALGAALVAQKDLRPDLPLPTLTHVYWGPAFEEDEIEAVLRRRGLVVSRPDDIARRAAEALADGAVVCWFSGRMEFGPRALGARSILADPRRLEIKDRVNRLKEREAWRPFGPSILAGHEEEWFTDPVDSRFMLVTADVRPGQRNRIPAVLHVDGTTRPQVVHPETHPAYHRVITAFFEKTGVPMLLNTSFNRRGEPIVCTPDQALDCFLDMKADALVLGPFWVEQPRPDAVRTVPSVADIEALRALPGGRRLSLRLTTRCACACVHCTLADIPKRGERPLSEVKEALIAGRRAGCDELVLMRGEPLSHSNILEILEFSRRVGYVHIQAQTSGLPLADPAVRSRLAGVGGLDMVEVLLWAADPALHDRLAGQPGAGKTVLLALRALCATPLNVLVTTPVLRDNRHELPKLVTLLARLGVTRLQFAFPRPMETPTGLRLERLLSLRDTAQALLPAAELARKQGFSVSTEGLPLCLLPDWLHQTPDASEDWRRHRIDDLHILHEALDAERLRARPLAPVCRTCARREVCPTTWALYQELFGSGEFRAIAETHA